MSSFGAVVADGWLYVYGGHTGEEHEHSAANLSKHFRRIQLDGGTEWEELPMQTPLQGLPLVAHGGKIYRVGGLNMRNATTKDDEDLHSTAEFAEFDPATSKWTALAPLPAARSSHNAVVIGDQAVCRRRLAAGRQIARHVAAGRAGVRFRQAGSRLAEAAAAGFQAARAGGRRLEGQAVRTRRHG